MTQQTFSDGEPLIYVRAKINDNATDAESRLASIETNGATDLVNRGVGATLVGAKIGPQLGVKGLVAGPGVSLVGSAGDVQISADVGALPQPGVFGETYLTAPATTAITTAGVAVKASGTFAAGDLNDFAATTDNRLTYEGGFDAFFNISATVSMRRPSGPSTEIFTASIARNGIVIEKSTVSRSFSSTSVGSVSLDILTAGLPGDYFELWVSNESSNGDVVVEACNLVITTSGGAPSGYDYVAKTWAELAAAAESYSGGLLTLRAASYLVAADIAAPIGETIILQAGTTLEGTTELGASVTFDNAAQCIRSPLTGVWAVVGLTVVNAGAGPCLECRSDAAEPATIRGCSFTGLGPLVDVAGVSRVTVSDTLLVGGTKQIDISASADLVVLRGCMFEGGAHGVYVEAGAVVTELVVSNAEAGVASTTSCMTVAGAVQHLRVVNSDFETAGDAIVVTGTVDGATVRSCTFITPTQADVFVGLAPTSQDLEGTPQVESRLIKDNEWQKPDHTEFVHLPESAPVYFGGFTSTAPSRFAAVVASSAPGTTLVLTPADFGTPVGVTAATAATFEIPNDATLGAGGVDLEGVFATITQLGAGQVTVIVDGGSGVTLRIGASSGPKTRGQYEAPILIRRLGTNEWLVQGGVA